MFLINIAHEIWLRMDKVAWGTIPLDSWISETGYQEWCIQQPWLQSAAVTKKPFTKQGSAVIPACVGDNTWPLYSPKSRFFLCTDPPSSSLILLDPLQLWTSQRCKSLFSKNTRRLFNLAKSSCTKVVAGKSCLLNVNFQVA